MEEGLKRKRSSVVEMTKDEIEKSAKIRDNVEKLYMTSFMINMALDKD